MQNITSFIESKLKLRVKTEKSNVALTNSVKFLGMTIVAATIAILPVSLKSYYDESHIVEFAKQTLKRLSGRVKIKGFLADSGLYFDKCIAFAGPPTVWNFNFEKSL